MKATQSAEFEQNVTLNTGGQKLRKLQSGNIIIAQFNGMGNFDTYLITNTETLVDAKDISTFDTPPLRGIIIQDAVFGGLNKVNYADTNIKWRRATKTEEKNFIHSILRSIVYPRVHGCLNESDITKALGSWKKRLPTMRAMLNYWNTSETEKFIADWVREEL